MNASDKAGPTLAGLLSADVFGGATVSWAFVLDKRYYV